MSRITKNMKQLENLSEKSTFIHNLNPITKIIITLIYLLRIICIGKYNIIELLILLVYPVVTMTLSKVPFMEIFKKALVALPFVLFAGVFNPMLDRDIMFHMGNVGISLGMISFAVILLKTLLAVSGVTILIATTGINKLCYGMRKLKIPSVFVILIELIYRYITVLTEEFATVTTAYRLRSSKEGIKLADGGTVLGNVLLRSISRAERIYSAMCLKGFKGEYPQNGSKLMRFSDYIYIIVWVIIFYLTSQVSPRFLGGGWDLLVSVGVWALLK